MRPNDTKISQTITVATGAPAPAMSWPGIEALPSVTLDAELLDKNGIVGFAARDIRARPFAMLRSQVQRRLARHRARIVGLTSATPAAGKSFMSINLAAALARVSEAPVYLVDLDLRRGAIASELGLDRPVGIANVLAGDDVDLAAVGLRVEGTNLAIFPTGPIDEGSAELLSGDRFARLTAGLRELPAETIVLCDMPPVFAGDDAMITLERLDGYILVVDSGKNAAKQVEHAMQLLDPTPCLGTILNRYRGGISDSNAYGYSYYASDTART